MSYIKQLVDTLNTYAWSEMTLIEQLTLQENAGEEYESMLEEIEREKERLPLNEEQPDCCEYGHRI